MRGPGSCLRVAWCAGAVGGGEGTGQAGWQGEPRAARGAGRRRRRSRPARGAASALRRSCAWDK